MKNNTSQLNLFDIISVNDCTKITDGKVYNRNSVLLSEGDIEKLNHYSLNDYISDVEKNGLETTWDLICQYAIDVNKNKFIDIKNFGELYEIGLATQDKVLKKKSGQYYTPDDVAKVMSEWLLHCDGDAVCDVACGTGKLILTYLEMLGYDKARDLISSGKLYLYDFDHVALKICRTTIAIKYGLDIAESINDVFCDFLDRDIKLPENCKVISNPPYAQLNKIQEYWEHTNVLLDTKEFYSAFMEKVFKQAKSTVIITPFSFINGSKFYSLRREMCLTGTGFIVAFDNVPGNIFCGRKHGIFNTNTANSVRASITVFHQDKSMKGFRVSPLIRFKNEERERLLKTDVLEKTIPDYYQIVDKNNESFKKIDASLTEIFDSWTCKSKFLLKDLLSKNENEFLIDTPNTCRYFTTASSKKLSRTGSITVFAKDKKSFNLIYCLINSSFAYWWWRIYDGGITYPVGLFNNLPIPLNLLTDDDDKFFEKITDEMTRNESKFIVTKLNAGVAQENIKFPENYREMINNRLLSILGFDKESSIFKNVHANKFFEDDN